MSDPKPVVVSLNVEGWGQSESEEVEIPRAEWDALTPAERVSLVEEMASDHAGNYVGWGWHIDDPSDYASAVDGAS